MLLCCQVVCFFYTDVYSLLHKTDGSNFLFWAQPYLTLPYNGINSHSWCQQNDHDWKSTHLTTCCCRCWTRGRRAWCLTQGRKLRPASPTTTTRTTLKRRVTGSPEKGRKNPLPNQFSAMYISFLFICNLCLGEKINID